MTTEESVRYLKNHPVFFSRLGFCYDPPLMGEDGRPVVFSRNFAKYAGYHKAMKEAGVNVHTCILHNGWVDVDTYDYSLCDEVLDALFSACGREILVIPRIKLNPPASWCRAYPEDTFVYFDGPRDRESIRTLAGGLRQDWLGYPSPKGYYQAGEYHDTRPNVDSLIGLQSFSSEQWRKDAGAALRRLINHLENGPYRDQILGYQVAYGRCGETILWGEYQGDYGINQLRNFYDFAVKKYGSQAKTEAAWGCPCDRDHVPLPSPEERYGHTDDLLRFYRADPQDTICTDYDEFLSVSNADSLEYFGRVIKSIVDKPVGAFYGYYLYLQFAQYAGHLALDRILSSPYIDFLASPVSYYRREVGDAGGEMTSIPSINRRKLWMSEIDNRSYLCAKGEIAVCDTPEETETVLARETAKATAADCGYWLMDLGGGWYDSPEMHGIAEKIVKNTAELKRTLAQSQADVLFLTSEKGLTHTNISDELTLTMQDLHTDAYRMGFWYDNYRPCDLKELDCSRYRVAVLSYTAEWNTKDIRRLFESLPKDAAIVFCGACGILKDGKVSLDHIRDLTGISVAYEGMQLFADDPQADILRSENGRAVIAEKTVNGRRHIVNFARRFPELAKIAREAGCAMHAPLGATTIGDARFSAVFSGEEPLEDVPAHGYKITREKT